MSALTKTRFLAPTRPVVGQTSGLSIVVLASNPNYRMKSYGPACLIKDSEGVSILERQVRNFREEFNDFEIIVVGGFDIDKLVRNKPSSVRIVENCRYEQTGEVEDIRLAINNALYESILIVHGDMYFSSPALRNFTKHSSLAVDYCKRMREEDVGATIVNNEITILSLSLKEHLWAKMSFFKDREFKLLKQFVNNRSNEKLFLFEAINHILEEGAKFIPHEIKGNEKLVHVDNNEMLNRI